MITFRGTVYLGELAVAPVVVAAVDYDAAHGGAVAVDPLGGRVDDYVGAPVEGVAEEACGPECVVDDQRHVTAFGQSAESLKVGHVTRGVAHALGIYHFGAVVYQGFERFG